MYSINYHANFHSVFISNLLAANASFLVLSDERHSYLLERGMKDKVPLLERGMEDKVPFPY
jgi:hypothetical protein